MPNEGRRALLLDLDGVLRIWHPENAMRAEARGGLPPGAILGTARLPALLQSALTGRISDETWRQQIADRLRAAYPAADVALAVALWSRDAGAIDPDVLALMRSRQDNVALVLVTNATTRLDRDLARLKMTAEFDQIINSSAIGHAKPDPEIFAQALASVAVAADDAFFVDDDSANVAAARQLGIPACVYDGAARLRAALVQHSFIA